MHSRPPDDLDASLSEFKRVSTLHSKCYSGTPLRLRDHITRPRFRNTRSDDDNRHGAYFYNRKNNPSADEREKHYHKPKEGSTLDSSQRSQPYISKAFPYHYLFHCCKECMGILSPPVEVELPQCLSRQSVIPEDGNHLAQYQFTDSIQVILDTSCPCNRSNDNDSPTPTFTAFPCHCSGPLNRDAYNEHVFRVHWVVVCHTVPCTVAPREVESSRCLSWQDILLEYTNFLPLPQDMDTQH